MVHIVKECDVIFQLIGLSSFIGWHNSVDETVYAMDTPKPSQQGAIGVVDDTPLARCVSNTFSHHIYFLQKKSCDVTTNNMILRNAENGRDRCAYLCFAMGGDVEDKAAHNERGHERSAAVRDKRQRKASERNDTEHRADIDEGLQDNDKRKSESD